MSQIIKKQKELLLANRIMMQEICITGNVNSLPVTSNEWQIVSTQKKEIEA